MINDLFQRLLNFRRRLQNDAGADSLVADSGVAVDPEMAKMMIEGILGTRPDELSCEESFELIDQFIELHLSDANSADLMPLVQDHLNRCGDCREEFEVLLMALEATA